MKKAMLFGLLGLIFLLGGYKQNVMRAATQASKAPATGAPSLSAKVNGIRTGMTVAQSKAAIPDLSCTSSTVKGHLLTQCEAVQRNHSVKAPWMDLGLYRGRVYSVTWYCMNSVEGCDGVLALMYAHWGKPRTYRTEDIPAEFGSFSEQVMRWRSGNEGAMFSFNKYSGPRGSWMDAKLSIMNYAFAPSGDDFVQPLRVGPSYEDAEAASPSPSVP
jgi:hypothetical protein